MKTAFVQISVLAGLIFTLFSCATTGTSVIVGGDYDEGKNQTDYFVLPYGSATLPGKWTKTSYNSVSHQQFFRNTDNVTVALAFASHDGYQFNANGAKKGFEFVKGYYEWDSQYFVDSHGLDREIIESDSTNHYMIYRIFGTTQGEAIDTWFLVGEKNGNTSNFSISITDKWSEEEKEEFLKGLFFQRKE